MTEDIKHLKWRHEALCDQIDREFDLLGQRMIWLVTSSAFLLTVMAISLSDPSETGRAAKILEVIIFGVPFLGMLTCILAYLTMNAARTTVRNRKANRLQVESAIKDKLSIEFDITVANEEDGHALGNSPYWIMPLAIIMVWLFILNAQWANSPALS